MNKKKYGQCIVRYAIIILASMTLYSSVSFADFLKPGVKVFLGQNDTLFKVCNRTDETLQIAIIYRHYWKFGEPPTCPAKGWFVLNSGGCTNLAVNNLLGFMSVVRETKDSKLEPYYTSSTPLKDITFYNNETKKFATKYLCLGDAPFDGWVQRRYG